MSGAEVWYTQISLSMSVPRLWNLTLMCSRQNMVEYIEEGLILFILLVGLFEQFLDVAISCLYDLNVNVWCAP